MTGYLIIPALTSVLLPEGWGGVILQSVCCGRLLKSGLRFSIVVHVFRVFLQKKQIKNGKEMIKKASVVNHRLQLFVKSSII